MRAKTLRKWVGRAEIDDGLRSGLTTKEAPLKELERENAESPTGQLPPIDCEAGPDVALSGSARSVNSRLIVVVALTAAVTFAMACTRTEPAAPPPISRLPSLRAGSASLDGAETISVQLVGLDTEGDVLKATDVAREVADDPVFVGAIGAPFISGPVQEAAGEVLDAAGIPTMTLLMLGRGLSDRGWTSWWRAVAGVEAVGEALATLVNGQPRNEGGACLLGDGSAGSRVLVRAFAASSTTRVVLRAQVSSGMPGPNGIAAAVSRPRCVAVVWGGSSGAGGLLSPMAGRRPRSRGRIRRRRRDLRTRRACRWPVGREEGTVAACACVDLSTSTRLADRRFIQDYRADFGLPPGP
jgi:hypothetical protein